MARVGNTMISSALALLVVWHLAPRTTMPSSFWSTMCTYRSGSSWAWGGFERSPLTSVWATATARSLSRQCR